MEGQELIKIEQKDGFQVEYELLLGISSEDSTDTEKSIEEIDAEIAEIDGYLDELNAEIGRLTNNADTIDYIVAVSSGVITGLIDSVFVGKLDMDSAKKWSKEVTDKFVKFAAKQNGYKGDTLDGAKRFLENKFPVSQDNAWSGKDFSSAKAHHIDDLAHHPTIVGLIAAIFVDFFKLGFFVDDEGKWHIVKLDVDKDKLFKKWIPLLCGIIFSAILKWIIYIIENKKEDELKAIPNGIKKLIKMIADVPALIPIFKTAAEWLGHLASDMAGTSGNENEGMGIPGIFMSLLKELSSIYPLNKTGLPTYINVLFENGRDLRWELAVLHEAGRQSIPVFINEFLVRGFYFVRSLCSEFKKNGGFNGIEWKNVVPFHNRTTERMMTIASGTFCAVDLADAAIRSGIESGGNPATFAEGFILRVNFVGLGRFAIAVGVDSAAGIKRQKAISERIELSNRKIALIDAKVYYIQSGVWEEALNTQAAVESLEKAGIAAFTIAPKMIGETFDDLKEMREADSALKKDEKIKKSIIDIL